MRDEGELAVVVETETERCVELLPTGLRLRRTPTLEEWAAVGTWLRVTEASVQWWVGDWLRLGEDTFGESMSQLLDATGWELDTLLRYRYVAARVPAERRVVGLSFSHHREVADLDGAEQTAWLARAATGDGDEGPWSSHRLRHELNAARHPEARLWVLVEAKDAQDAERVLAWAQTTGRAAKVRGRKAAHEGD